MSSQYGEHDYILEYFAGRIGRFLDVGAFDGVTFSNTRPLADLGWYGVCVEPSPPAFCWLMKNYAGNNSVQLVNAGVGCPGLKRFFSNTADSLSAEMMSSFSPEHVAKFAGFPFREIWTPLVDWSTLMDEFAGALGFDFVNIDVEGTNVELLESFPWERIGPAMICIEMDPADKVAWMSVEMAQNGLTEQRIIGGNLLAARPK